jgi:chemotaxis protein methyltransferase CheR
MTFTFFFRDSEALELAVEQMLPVANDLNSIDIWDAGCAHGPEPYTLAIMLREKMPEVIFRKVRILATDVDGGFSASVSEGCFPEPELRRLPPGIRDKYFRPDGDSDRFRLLGEIRSAISFAQHDLLSLEPAGRNFSLIVCKNVLLHFNEEQRCRVLWMLHGALRCDGVLVMEHTQKIPPALSSMFQPMVCHAQVFAKAAAPLRVVYRRDLPGNVCRPFFWKKAFIGKSDTGPLEKSASGAA